MESYEQLRDLADVIDRTAREHPAYMMTADLINHSVECIRLLASAQEMRKQLALLDAVKSD